MEYVAYAIAFGVIVLVGYLVGKYDPVTVISWYCEKCQCEVGRGSVRRAKIDIANHEHHDKSPGCDGQLIPIEGSRHPFYM